MLSNRGRKGRIMGSISRREFCALAAGAACSTDAFGRLGTVAPPEESPERAMILPKIDFGRTGRSLPRLGLGTDTLGDIEDDREAVDVLLKAIAFGVRYIDTAYIYGNGRSEMRVGTAIAESGIDRSEFFVATKTAERDKAGALQQLQVSLRRLRMDYVDAWQVHSLTFDPEPLFQPGTVIEAMEQARAEGRVRFIGITSHEAPANMLRAIELYKFDLALIAINKVHTEYMSRFVPLARDQGMGVVAMKVFGHGQLFREFTARQLLQFVLEQPGVQIAVPGLDAKWQVDEAFRAVAG